MPQNIEERLDEVWTLLVEQRKREVKMYQMTLNYLRTMEEHLDNKTPHQVLSSRAKLLKWLEENIDNGESGTGQGRIILGGSEPPEEDEGT